MEDSKLIKYILEEIDERERQEVEEWISDHPSHKRQYDHIKIIWDKSKNITPNKPIDVNKAWESFLIRKEGKRPFLGKGHLLHPWYKVAAAVSIILVASFLMYFKSMQPDNFLVSNLLLESSDKYLSDTLFDGSIITLNKRSKLSFNQSFINDKRKASLMDGEAFFQVTRNENRPFLVKVGDVTIKVLGTSFNIKKQNEIVEVILKSGSVQVEYEDEKRTLKPGDKLLVNTAKSMISTSSVEDNLYNYYVGDFFIADKTPLWRIIEVLNEAYGANIILVNDSLRNLPLTTTFRNNSLENNLEVLKATFGLNIIREPNRIVIK